MSNKKWKRAAFATIAGMLAFGGAAVTISGQFDGAMTVPAGLRNVRGEDAPIQHIPFAKFSIPFDVDRNGRTPAEVQLWVSPDSGKSWMNYSTATPERRALNFMQRPKGNIYLPFRLATIRESLHYPQLHQCGL